MRSDVPHHLFAQACNLLVCPGKGAAQVSYNACSLKEVIAASCNLLQQVRLNRVKVIRKQVHLLSPVYVLACSTQSLPCLRPEHTNPASGLIIGLLVQQDGYCVSLSNAFQGKHSIDLAGMYAACMQGPFLQIGTRKFVEHARRLQDLLLQ